MGYIKVKGHDGLVRDETSGAIVNHSDSAIQARRKQRQLNSALDDINMLKDEVSEIKSLLRELIKNARN
jgi:tRNA uridine 5-carbamoylmethylation protein Kti12